MAPPCVKLFTHERRSLQKGGIKGRATQLSTNGHTRIEEILETVSSDKHKIDLIKTFRLALANLVP